MTRFLPGSCRCQLRWWAYLASIVVCFWISFSAAASPAIQWTELKAPLALLEVPQLQCVGIPQDQSGLERARAELDALAPGAVSPVIWGFGDTVVWCRLTVLNTEERTQELHWDFRYAFYDFIRFYVSQGGEAPRLQASMGDFLPFDQRLVSTAGFEFPFELAPDEEITLYAEMTSTELLVTPSLLMTSETSRRLNKHWSFASGLVYGGSLLLGLFHLILFIFTRNTKFFVFAGFVFAQTMFLMSFRGVAFEILWPNLVDWHHKTIPFFSALAQASSIALVVSYLPVDKLKPIWLKVAHALIVLNLLMAGLPWLDSGSGPFFLLSVGSFLSVTWVFLCSIAAWRIDRSARVVASSFTIMILFLALDTIRVNQLVGDGIEFGSESLSTLGDFTLFWLARPAELGFFIAEFLLAVGLADQINVLRSDRARLRKEALDAALVSQEKLKSEVERQTLELKESRDRLLRIDEEKTAFFRMVSHELRTPLTLLQLPLERLEEEMGDNASLDMARRNAMRLQRLVNQLLDLQKSEVGRREEPLIRIEVHPFLATAGLYFAEAALAKGVRFELRREGRALDPSEDYGDPLYMHADIDGLEKIIFNFLANALKFTDAGGTIALGYRRLDSGEIRIEVTDTGIGISEEDIKRLFSAFTQLDDSEARKVEGTGLGLALSKQLAEYMGGQVGVSSVVGEGSTFYLDIHEIEVATEVESLEWSPREWLMAEHQQRRGELRSDDASELSIVDGRGKSVLIVDDLPDMRALLTSLLEAQGYHVIEASDGQEALTLASRQPLDLMITDWMMPEMSGPELIASLRELPGKQGLPIILLTANADERARIEGVDTGADAFLSKPFQNRELLATVRNLLSLKVREGELEDLVIELRQTQEQLVAQSRMATLGELASGLAHEIRNPMNLAQGGVEEISEALKEPERDAAFDKQIEGLVSLIQRGIDRIESVIGRLHRLSQVRKSKVGGSSDLAAVVDDLRSFLNLSEAGRGALVEVDVPDGVEVGLDSGALNQVLLNLSLNAIQAGGKEVTLKLFYEPSQTENLAGVLRVSDNGPGIPGNIGERIFEPFYTGRAEGTGLGLPLCRTIVREAGGRLWLDTNYPGGASFCIELPRPTDDDSLEVATLPMD